ncbi:MAG: galactitol-1-phosphate 5-dehydrogenase, partial [Lachnospiraceae bacterium]|nr:galactitol-1-phosphate 5-dehydrogenase [Lachnospiraceae bacterium]
DMTLDKNIYWKILRNQLIVTGTWNSSFTHEEDDDWHYVVDKLADGAVKPEELISHRLSLEELERGMEIMRDKSEDYVKVMGVL